MTELYDARLGRNPAVLLSPVEGGYIAYDTSADRLHELNPIAALLVELFDGDRTVADVLEIARPLFPEDADDAVAAWIQRAVTAELLCRCVGVAKLATHCELTAEQLVDLARKLRDEGKVQAAFLCQQRAVEIGRGAPHLWRLLGELAHIVGKRDVARSAYQHYVELCPHDAEIQHLLTSLRNDALPDRVPDACIQQLYERFSSFYEENMCGDLSYEGPKHLATVVDHTLGRRTGLRVLDLGCGTGLAASAIAGRAEHLVGVDLSPEMVAKARERNIYDELHVAEVTDFLSRGEDSFDLIMACDTLIYFGDLTQVLQPAARRLNSGGVLAFSVELALDEPFQLTDSGRYIHHPSHIHAAAAAAGLRVRQARPEFLRMEYGEEVAGFYVTATRDDATTSPSTVGPASANL